MPPDDHDDNFTSSDNVVALPSNDDIAVIERLAALDSLFSIQSTRPLPWRLGAMVAAITFSTAKGDRLQRSVSS